MRKNQIVSIGDLVTDYYYEDGKIIGLSGGMSCHNIIANLAKMGIATSVIGVCGDDKNGFIAIKSLEDVGIDTSGVTKLKDINTRMVHISYFNKKERILSSKLECPCCNKINWYNESLLKVDNVLNNVKDDDILVFDSLNEVNRKVIEKTSNIKVIDIGHVCELDKITLDELKQSYNSKFTIININNNVYDFILNKFNLKNYLDFNAIFNAKLVIVTNGKKGASFIINNKLYKFKLVNIAREIDATGAGDAFFSSILYDYINNDLVINEYSLKKWFNNATKLTSEVVKHMGARGHIHNLYKIKPIHDKCLCDDYDLEVLDI